MISAWFNAQFQLKSLGSNCTFKVTVPGVANSNGNGWCMFQAAGTDIYLVILCAGTEDVTAISTAETQNWV